MSRTYDFDHHVPGLVMVAGIGAMGAGTVLPWIRETGPTVGINLDIFSAQVQKQSTIDGLSKGVGGVVQFILVAGAIALLAAISLMATHRRRGLFLRLVALCCGVAVGALGAYFLTLPNQRQSVIDQGLTKLGALSVQPGIGTYLLAFGGLAVVLGALVPGRRTALAAPATQPRPAWR